MKDEFIREWLEYPSRIKILMIIKNSRNNYGSKIIRRQEVTSKSVWNAIKFLKEKGLIYFPEKETNKSYKNRTKYFFLTEKGKLIAKKIQELEDLLSLNSRQKDL